MSTQEPIHLILVRHGNTFESGQTPVQVGSLTDLELTIKGKDQAHAFARSLNQKGVIPAAIYAGILKRQIESAKIIGSDLQVEKKIHLNEPALTEIDYGLWEGLTSEEIDSQWPKEYADWSHQAKWAEKVFGGSLEWHLHEIDGWLKSLRKAYSPGDTVVGITSNGVIRLFYSYEESEWEKLCQGRKIDDLKVKTGNYCELLLFQDSLKVKSWNKVPV